MYPRFFRFLDFLHFISYKFYEIIILSCDLTTSERKKLWRNIVFTTLSIHVASLTLTLWFLRCSPSRAFKLFWQFFLVIFKLSFRLLMANINFNAGGLWECYANWIKSRNTQRLRPNNLIFLVSSPKQSRRFTNFYQQIIGVVWLTEKFAFYYRCISESMDELP